MFTYIYKYRNISKSFFSFSHLSFKFNGIQQTGER